MLTKVESGFWLLKWYHQGILEEIDYYSSPDIYDSLCSLRQQIQNADQAALIMHGWFPV